MCHGATDPDENRNVTQLITSKGYPCDDYTVTTEDGYILSLQNIPYGRSGPSSSRGYPVLLQHGFLDSASTWVINNATQSLGFLLADAGYDVWLGNSRGNAYCQANTMMSNTSQEFWNFSWDELAKYDLPAKIDFVLQTNGAKSLSYVGHSEGTMIGFAQFEDASLASKVDLFVALAPVAYLNNVGEILIEAAKVPDLLVKLVFGTKGFLQPWSRVAGIEETTCSDDPIVCEELVCALAGCENTSNLNRTRLDVYFSHFPSGSSVQNLFHYQQAVRGGEFQMYDFGRRGNEQHYGQNDPPQYNLTAVTTNTALIYGSHDKMADPTDVQHMISEMTPSSIVYQEEVTSYGHADFVWGLDATEKVYNTVLSLIAKYRS